MHTRTSFLPENGHPKGPVHPTSAGFSPAQPRVPNVIAGLGYLSPTSERPYRYMYRPPAGEAWHNCDYELIPSPIADARAMAMPPTIDVEGFELRDAPSSVTNFAVEAAIRDRYYPEAIELAKSVTGADHAVIFDHAVRRRETGRPELNFGRDSDAGPLGAVGRVHVDYSEASGRGRLQLLAAEDKVSPDPQRFAIINIWRSIAGKIVDTPLALCDARSVSVKDLVVTDLRYRDRMGEIYLVQRSPYHRWAYFPEMARHEALIFKQYDSQVSGIARFTPHSAFDLPDIPADAPLRESIEVRCLVTYN